jgi:RHS repeat-associated protein
VQPYTWKGREWMAGPDLYYNRARFYDPQLGRFTSEDPLGYAAGDSNVYTFGWNNPKRWNDPSGLTAGGEQGGFSANILRAAPAAAAIGIAIAIACVMNSIADALEYYGDVNPVVAMAVEFIACRVLGKAPGAIGAVGGRIGRGSGPGIGGRAGTKGNTGPAEPAAVIGRTNDLKTPRAGERPLLDRLPNLGDRQANWKQNSGVLRQEMNRGLPIRDASPGDTGGWFLNAERYLLRDRGWLFDPKTNYWYPPKV